jgi:hypothetical protein
MAQLSDKTLAERMLQARERGGHKILPFVRMNAKGYTFLVLYFGAVLTFLAFTGLWSAFCVILGLILGVLLRDVSWLIGIQRTWPFVTKVIDWDKVKRAADGETLA